MILIGLVFSAAAALQGLSGFGFSLVAVGILSMLIGPKLAVPLSAVVSAVNCIYLACLLRRSILFKPALMITGVAILFVPVGTLFLRDFPRSVIVRTLGVVVIVVSSLSLVNAKKLRLFASRPYKYIAGAASGLLGGAFNIPGPPLVLYSYNCDWPLRNAMATLQLMFTAVAATTILSFFLTGLLTPNTALWGLAYAPVVVLFSLAGSRISKKLNVERLGLVTNTVLLLLGISLLIRG